VGDRLARAVRVLFTNNGLADRAGTEVYLRDLAVALVRRGHDVAAYSRTLGPIAEELRDHGVVVVSLLSALPWRPDVIHGHHHLPTMTAVLHLGDVPAVFVCHGFLPWQETPPLHPRILRFAAVDEMTLDAAVREHGVTPERIRLIPNFVDLDRFRPRSALPSRPRRALLLSKHATPTFIYPSVLAGCRICEVELDAIGTGIGTVTDRPEDLLGQYDLVFAKGRTALEAMAVGSAVVIVGLNGIGPMVDTRQFDRFRRMNFGAKRLMKELSASAVAREIGRYDAVDAAQVMGKVRQEAGLDQAAEEYLALYGDVIEEFRRHPDISRTADTASADYLAGLEALVKGADLRAKNGRLRRQRLRRQLAEAQRSVAALEQIRVGRVPLIGGLLERRALKRVKAGSSRTHWEPGEP
jgi:hypothetical protein